MRNPQRVPDARTGRWLGVTAFVAFFAAQAYGFFASPPDAAMGHLQKIMYVHVPTAWVAFLAFFVVFIFSALYLIRRRESDDLLAFSAAEVGAVLTALTLLQGSIWGRPTWGVWWTWDPRLTTTAILLLIYAGYLALRAFTEEPERRARWSAAVGILGFINVPIVFMSVRWWRTLHQPQSTIETVSSTYVWALFANFAAFMLLFAYFLVRRYRAAQLERAVDAALEAEALGGPSAPGRMAMTEGGVRG